ncbi:mitotic spindle assembly checkpoint protein MAD2B isoform X2 [Octopus bimaculoides]|uniref:Mitotic spindle assembly checkpoint protein MAD2B n=1 Tax=Octopus bimaculoides TaxID=37653 RepID=A0A0L8HAB4_OCTBM|nr:mitotic spindle assembly checkpoint protein MAD2B isoform X2 [Octopus bimaculoides]|eukprot:XP_014774077.1 PREDICTED: mitotic spindle assembly checkpoint protein MAD2B-like [Octopus bimaculoides]
MSSEATLSSTSKVQVAADIVTEFLEVAIHCILHHRDLYPAGVFETRKKYNVPVQMCLHPDVIQYITNILESIKLLLEAQEVNRVGLVILDSKQTPIERFVFEIAYPSLLSGFGCDILLTELEQSLRAFLLKINVCDALLKPLPQDVSWVIHIHTSDSAMLRLEEKQILKNFPWIEAEEKQKTMSNSSLVPMKTVNSDIVKMQLFVEESSLKRKLDT